MWRGMMGACLLGLLRAMPLSAQEAAFLRAAPVAPPDGQLCPLPGTDLAPPASAPTPDEVRSVEAMPWQTVWGLLGLRAIPAGPTTAPNGVIYHPNFSIDLNFNCWVWR